MEEKVIGIISKWDLKFGYGLINTEEGLKYLAFKSDIIGDMDQFSINEEVSFTPAVIKGGHFAFEVESLQYKVGRKGV